MVYDSVSNRVILAFNASLQRDNSPNPPVPVGTRIYLAQYPNAAGGDGFDYWVPLCKPYIDPQTGRLVDMINGNLAPAAEPWCDQFGQSLAAIPFGATSQAAAAWHDTRDSTSPPPSPLANAQVDIWAGSIRPGSPLDIHSTTTQNRVTPLGGGVPWTQTGINSYAGTAWGDYEGMTAHDGVFYPAWGDNRDGSLDTRIFTSSFTPP